MSRENSPSYAKIGFIVVVGLAAIVAVAAYFLGYAKISTEMLVETYYDKPVSGLSVGSPVSFRGVKVGSVKSISFIGRDYPTASETDREKIHIVFSVDTELAGLGEGQDAAAALENKVRSGLRATLRTNGITGLSRLDLDYPSVLREQSPITWSPKNVFVPPEPSLLESLSDSLTKTANHLNRMNLPQLGSNVVATVEATSELTSNLNELVEYSSPDIKAILENLSMASASLRVFADEIRDNPSLLLRPREEEALEETK